MQFLTHFLLNKLHPLFIHKIAFVEDNDTLLNTKLAKNVHMFSCLRHDSLIRRDYKHDQIHPYHACNHIVDKTLMSRHVDNPCPVAVWKVEVGKSKIDRDPSSLLFFPSVCISSCQRLDQRRLSMVNMTGCSYDNVFHVISFPLSLS